ncbi:unnamed protein product [Sphenostylis stenocarpa]|uniref:Uncharacterized protein n=1 Tax=Sphenostylis stenocarpa TaxID=92480 RepID=A0AA86VKZ0_9FABA|nr:unnamed protein product [Sphenostylis stenocarpa]
MVLHKWSSAEFPEEYALVHITDNSKRSILRLRVNGERVVLRVAESMCDHHPVRLLHMEVTAQRDTVNCFDFQQVRVVVDGTSQQTQPMGMGTESWSDLCGRKSCFYEVTRKVGNIGSVEKVSWEFFHSYTVFLRTHIRYHVIIECDKERGLRANIRGPFKCEGPVLRDSLVTAECERGSLIQRVVEEEAAKDMRGFAESARFHGHANASTFQGWDDDRSIGLILNTGIGNELGPLEVEQIPEILPIFVKLDELEDMEKQDVNY